MRLRHPGSAVDGSRLPDTGYLVVFPHAGGMWWEERQRRMVRALLDEVMRRFNVDGDRVFLAGFSNGGTGSLYYGWRTAWRLTWTPRVEALG